MKPICLTAIILIVNFLVVNAQEIDQQKPLKNEIGLHVGAIGSILMGGGYLSAQPLGIVYKRVNGNKAFRASYQVFDVANDFIPITTKEEIGDNRYVSRFQSNRMLQHIFRVGKERRIPLKKDIQLVFGADFQARYLAISNFTHFNYYRLDSISDQGLISQKSHYSRSEPESQFVSTTKGWQYGLGLSGGVLLPVAKRWWLNANFRVDSFYGRLYDRNQNIYTSAIDRDDYLQFSLETGSIISELTLFYRF